MQEYNIDANAAFELIGQLSRDSNTKIVELAQQVVASSQRNSQ